MLIFVGIFRIDCCILVAEFEEKYLYYYEEK